MVDREPIPDAELDQMQEWHSELSDYKSKDITYLIAEVRGLRTSLNNIRTSCGIGWNPNDITDDDFHKARMIIDRLYNIAKAALPAP